MHIIRPNIVHNPRLQCRRYSQALIHCPEIKTPPALARSYLGACRKWWGVMPPGPSVPSMEGRRVHAKEIADQHQIVPESGREHPLLLPAPWGGLNLSGG